MKNFYLLFCSIVLVELLSANEIANHSTKFNNRERSNLVRDRCEK